MNEQINFGALMFHMSADDITNEAGVEWKFKGTEEWKHRASFCLHIEFPCAQFNEYQIPLFSFN